jgi:hypothetical protein
MVLRIQYRNGNYDYVTVQTLDDLINKGKITQFYRPLEKKWIKIDTDPIRRKGSGPYDGPERRK